MNVKIFFLTLHFYEFLCLHVRLESNSATTLCRPTVPHVSTREKSVRSSRSLCAVLQRITVCSIIPRVFYRCLKESL